ncbi:MAG TPA: hypothetical protein DC048_07200 [Planctomycetaceae bacterium]|nr:hypothetical protein [Planctomycetaceae bacterium]
MEIAVLAAIGLLLLGGIVAFAVGNRGWSIGTVVAALLVLLATGGFLYLATRLAARDAAWAKAVSDLEQRLAKARDGLGPTADGRLEPLPDVKSVAMLREERDRWSRAAATVDTWRTRSWENASYEPDGGDGPKPGARITVPRPPRPPAPAAAGADPNQPAPAPQPPLLAAGAMIFLFDESPLAEGGRYLGAFTVREAAFDAGIDSQVLTATFVGEPNERERKVLSEPHGPVTIYDELPVDRWIAFFRLNPSTDAANAYGVTARNDVAAQFDGIDDDDVRALVQAFVERFEQHDSEVSEAEWPAALQQLSEGAVVPGSFWATVEFTKSHTFAGAAGSTSREFTAGDKAEFDLATALELRDRDLVQVRRVVRRRPLSDALAAIYGTQVGPVAEQGDGGSQRADGAMTLLRQLRSEIVVIDTAAQRLDQALAATTANTEATTVVVQELTEDLGSWERDATAATGVADAFATSIDKTTRQREQADQAVVALGRELAATLARLTAEIDRVAPAPGR